MQERLQTDFPYTPKAHIVKAFQGKNGLYAPTYIALTQEQQDGQNLPYTRKRVPYKPSAKSIYRTILDAEFEEEREWLQEEAAKRVQVVVEQSGDQEDEDPENGIECGCCFASCSFVGASS